MQGSFIGKGNGRLGIKFDKLPIPISFPPSPIPIELLCSSNK